MTPRFEGRKYSIRLFNRVRTGVGHLRSRSRLRPSVSFRPLYNWDRVYQAVLRPCVANLIFFRYPLTFDLFAFRTVRHIFIAQFKWVVKN